MKNIAKDWEKEKGEIEKMGCGKWERDETKWLPDSLRPKECEKLRGGRTQNAALVNLNNVRI